MRYVNDVFIQFAHLFTGWRTCSEELACADQLDRTKLDYSVDSLKVVDLYLNYLHAHRTDRLGRDWVNTILWGGAYVGEVIRENANRNYEWVDFDDRLQEHPEQRQIIGSQKAIQVCAFLTPGGGAFTLPLNKVFKFIVEGESESVWFYALAELKNA